MVNIMIETIFNDTSNIESLTFMIEQIYAHMFEKELDEILKPNSTSTIGILEEEEEEGEAENREESRGEDNVVPYNEEERIDVNLSSGRRGEKTMMGTTKLTMELEGIKSEISGLTNRMQRIEGLLQQIARGSANDDEDSTPPAAVAVRTEDGVSGEDAEGREKSEATGGK